MMAKNYIEDMVYAEHRMIGDLEQEVKELKQLLLKEREGNDRMEKRLRETFDHHYSTEKRVTELKAVNIKLLKACEKALPIIILENTGFWDEEISMLQKAITRAKKGAKR